MREAILAVFIVALASLNFLFCQNNFMVKGVGRVLGMQVPPSVHEPRKYVVDLAEYRAKLDLIKKAGPQIISTSEQGFEKWNITETREDLDILHTLTIRSKVHQQGYPLFLPKEPECWIVEQPYESSGKWYVTTECGLTSYDLEYAYRQRQKLDAIKELVNRIGIMIDVNILGDDEYDYFDKELIRFLQSNEYMKIKRVGMLSSTRGPFDLSIQGRVYRIDRHDDLRIVIPEARIYWLTDEPYLLPRFETSNLYNLPDSVSETVLYESQIIRPLGMAILDYISEHEGLLKHRIITVNSRAKNFANEAIKAVAQGDFYEGMLLYINAIAPISAGPFPFLKDPNFLDEKSEHWLVSAEREFRKLVNNFWIEWFNTPTKPILYGDDIRVPLRVRVTCSGDSGGKITIKGIPVTFSFNLGYGIFETIDSLRYIGELTTETNESGIAECYLTKLLSVGSDVKIRASILPDENSTFEPISFSMSKHLWVNLSPQTVLFEDRNTIEPYPFELYLDDKKSGNVYPSGSTAHLTARFQTTRPGWLYVFNINAIGEIVYGNGFEIHTYEGENSSVTVQGGGWLYEQNIPVVADVGQGLEAFVVIASVKKLDFKQPFELLSPNEFRRRLLPFTSSITLRVASYQIGNN